MATIQGNTVASGNSEARLEIDYTTTDNGNSVKLKVSVYFRSKWAVSDTNNTFKADWNLNASTEYKNVNIQTTVSSGESWNAANRCLIATYDHDYDKSKGCNFNAKLTGIDAVGSNNEMSVTLSIAPISYTVTFNPNGGTITSGSATQTIGYGGSATPPTVSRDKYTFGGWSGTYTNVTSNRTITATWNPFKHTVAYNGNGGTNVPPNQTKTYGTAMSISSTIPTRTGYNFVSWNTKVDGSGTSYNAGANYTPDQNGGTVTLYAQWTPWVHTISYNGNGGTNVPANQTKTYGSTIKLSSVAPKRTGYTFTGWKASFDGLIYQPGATYSYDQNGGTVILTAQWKHANVAYMKINGKYVLCNVYIKINNSWKPALIYLKDDGIWKLSID